MKAARMALFPLLAGLGSCVPWTVRPIESKDDKPRGRFEAAAYVDSIWASRVLPTVANSAVEWTATRGKTGAFMIKGRAKVLAVDTATRAGTATLDMVPCDGRPDALLQIGPVIRGSSLRDAVGFIHFGDFVNQLDFASAGNELNDRVEKTVLAGLEPASLKGSTVTFYGTFAASDAPLPRIVPVKLTVERTQ